MRSQEGDSIKRNDNNKELMVCFACKNNDIIPMSYILDKREEISSLPCQKINTLRFRKHTHGRSISFPIIYH